MKETSPEGMRRCTIIFDTSVRDDPQEFEQAVSVAASLVTGASAAGLVTRFVSTGADMRGPDVAETALRWLATVEPTSAPLAAPSGGRFGDGVGLVLLVTSVPDGRAVDAIRSSLSPDDVLVLVCTALALGTVGRFVVDASDEQRFVASWTDLTGRHRSAEPSASGAGGWR